MGNWKQEHACASGEALRHPIVKRVVDELLFNLRADGDSLVRYGVMKVATYAAQVARAQALGIDPAALLLTPEEAGEEQARLVQMATDAGVRTLVVVPPDAAAREGGER